MNQLTDSTPTVLWQGRTPVGLPIVVERDSGRRCIATVAGTMQSRSTSVVIAVAEATALPSRHPWVTWIAQMCTHKEATS